MTAALCALDDFAGAGGWSVACQRLGIVETGVEIMPEARATRDANGFDTVAGDIWEHLEATADTPLAYDLLISSPPCQTFSMAGGGAGRRALDEVVGLIDSKAYADVAQLRAFSEAHDPRTALVLTPLVRVYRDGPTYVVLEQVPPVLPVWERMAVELRRWGYSVVTGVLNAEQYGVPQTRRRAVLIARADGVEAAMPTPTHSRYYSRDPKRLDPGVLPWVSMAEALGWGGDEATMHRHRGAGMTERHGERPGRPVDEPSLTVTGNASGTTPGGFVITPGEGLRGPWGMTERPYVTVASGTEAGGGTDPMALGGSGARKTVARERERGAWVELDDRPDFRADPEKPATTVAADPRLSAREHHHHGEQSKTSTRVTIDEAAALQSFPPGFTFAGTKTKAFLQVGNAVPPLLAEAILATLLPKEGQA